MVESIVSLSLLRLFVAWDDGVTTALVRSATLKLVWSSSEEDYWLLVCVRVSYFHVFGLRVTNHKSSYHP